MVTVFTTESGTTYQIDKEDQTLTRIVPSNGSSLRRDGEAIYILLHDPIEVGKPAVFWLDIREDGVPTHRTTSAVASIREGN